MSGMPVAVILGVADINNVRDNYYCTELLWKSPHVTTLLVVWFGGKATLHHRWGQNLILSFAFLYFLFSFKIFV
jgi:hypothetical protein